jgi:hypothetical protein
VHTVSGPVFTKIGFLHVFWKRIPFRQTLRDLLSIWQQSSIRTSTHPMVMLLALSCTQVHWFFSQPNLCPCGSRFCETYWL